MSHWLLHMLQGGGTTSFPFPQTISPHNPQHFMYLNIHIWFEFETCTGYSSWQKFTIDDVIILDTRLEYNLQTRNKMTTSWQSRDLHTIYRPDRKLGPGFLSQVLCGVLITKFGRYVRMTKELHTWHHRCGHVTQIKLSYQIENEDQIWCVKCYMHYWLPTLSDTLRWQNNYIHDIIMVVTWLGYNLQTR